MTIPELVSRQREYFKSNATRDVGFRKDQLRRLSAIIEENEQSLLDAVYSDLRKSRFHAITTELSFLYGEIAHSIRNVDRWSRKKRIGKSLLNFPERSYLLPEPYGVTYIAGAWNYPYQLTLLPLISSIAAGNTAVVKPSERASNTSRAMAALINENYPEEYVHVLEGGPETGAEILRERFDKIFYTGGSAVGKIVYEAAARNLTPVTLELGGKNPAIVLPDCNVEITAKRIVWGKFLNAGQTCVAPDYLMVHSSVEKRLLEELQRVLSMHYSRGSIGDDYAAIIDAQHFDRLKMFLDPDKVVYGGTTNREERFISPTILRNITFDDDIMREEIFGPLLPVIGFDDLHSVVEKIKSFEKPLSLYLFGKKSALTDSLFEELSFGGGSLNDTVMYFADRKLPYGGVGASGMGTYHGEYGFKAFSHDKAIMEKGTWVDFWSIKMSPHTKLKTRILRWLIEH